MKYIKTYENYNTIENTTLMDYFNEYLNGYHTEDEWTSISIRDDEENSLDQWNKEDFTLKNLHIWAKEQLYLIKNKLDPYSEPKEFITEYEYVANIISKTTKEDIEVWKDSKELGLL